MLLAVVAYAVQREFAAQPAGNTAAPAVSSVPARALSAEEEAYAAALWSIHREVKLAALGMTFAGIAYKTDSQDRATLQAKVEPLTQVFRTAIADARALDVPASVRDVHERYLGALASYESRVGGNGQDGTGRQGRASDRGAGHEFPCVGGHAHGSVMSCGPASTSHIETNAAPKRRPCGMAGKSCRATGEDQ